MRVMVRREGMKLCSLVYEENGREGGRGREGKGCKDEEKGEMEGE